MQRLMDESLRMPALCFGWQDTLSSVVAGCGSLTVCSDLQCNCAMGLMPEIKRAWLTIDSNIYLWNYEDG